MSAITTVAQLEAIYGHPGESSTVKVANRITASYRVLIEKSPFAALATCGPEGLDSQDWMAREDIRALWDSIDRAGTDQVRVILRTAGTESPLGSEELEPLREIWRRDDELSDVGHQLDRSGIYGGFHCYVRR